MIRLIIYNPFDNMSNLVVNLLIKLTNTNSKNNNYDKYKCGTINSGKYMMMECVRNRKLPYSMGKKLLQW